MFSWVQSIAAGQGAQNGLAQQGANVRMKRRQAAGSRVLLTVSPEQVKQKICQKCCKFNDLKMRYYFTTKTGSFSRGATRLFRIDNLKYH
jgi:hypothetical protein